MSLSLITLELVLRNILQNCGWPIHHKEWILISTRDHHRSPYSVIKTSKAPLRPPREIETVDINLHAGPS
jgi:hypothetical protein